MKENTKIYVLFNEIGYSRTELCINLDKDTKINYSLFETSIDTIKKHLLKFTQTYNIDWEQLDFRTSPQLYNIICKKTLYCNKSLKDLFSEQFINIKKF